MEQEYITFLWDAFETDYIHGKLTSSPSSLVRLYRTMLGDLLASRR